MIARSCGAVRPLWRSSFSSAISCPSLFGSATIDHPCWLLAAKRYPDGGPDLFYAQSASLISNFSITVTSTTRSLAFESDADVKAIAGMCFLNSIR